MEKIGREGLEAEGTRVGSFLRTWGVVDLLA